MRIRSRLTAPVAVVRAARAAAVAVLVTLPVAVPAHGAGGNPFPGPVGGARLGGGPAVVTAATGAVTPVPAVKAASWLVADLDTGEVLAAKAPHARLRPASTLKTLTALVLLPRMDKTDQVVGTNADAGIDGSKVGIAPGLRYSVDRLFLGLFLSSGNDAVHALATHDGGIPATVARMNAAAATLGAFDTRVVDPTGLDADGQLSSAYDLALISRAGLRRADFRRYVGTRKAYYPLKPAGQFQISNQNPLLWSYPGAIGVKTGFTTLARNTFVGAAGRDGHRLVVTLLNAPHGVAKDAAALLDWTFAHRTALRGVGTLVTPAEVARARAKPPTTAPDADDTGSDTEPDTGSDTGSDPGPPPAATPLSADGPLRIVQAVVAHIPLWAYPIPPVVLVLTWLRPRRTRARARRARR